MKNLDTEKLKFLAEMGLIYRVFLREYPRIDGGGWFLEIDSKAELKSPVLMTKRGGVKVFKSADSAIDEVRRTGYGGSFHIYFDQLKP